MIFCIPFCLLNLQTSIYLLHLEHLRSLNFLFEIFYLHSDFMKFIIDKVDSHTQVVPIILKSFPVTELSISLKCICKSNQKFSSSVALATFQGSVATMTCDCSISTASEKVLIGLDSTPYRSLWPCVERIIFQYCSHNE